VITEYLSNLEKNHEFYIRLLKDGRGSKDMLHVEIEILYAVFEVTKNPIFLWRAIKTCIEAEIEFPKWITDYLLKSSCKIVDSAYNYNPREREKDLVADAFDFKKIGGPWNNFTQYIERLKWHIRVSEVMQIKMRSDLKFTKIEEQIANKYFPDDVDAASAEARRLRNWREKLQKIPIGLDLG
jgi:hypothetical protein